MTPAGSFHSFAPAPTSTKNRFAALADINAIDSNGEILVRSEEYTLQSFLKTPVKQTKPSKKRR